jgi:hypothetical protein
MDTHRKNAYRFLVYWAMLDIRPLAWHGYVRGWRKLNPLNWRRQMRAMRVAGEWMHNLAMFAAVDFDGFDEGWFWEDGERFKSRCPGTAPNRYRQIFEERLRQLEQGVAGHSADAGRENSK